MGMSISDAIRLLMLRIAEERCLPFKVKTPNTVTRKASAELEAGKGKKFSDSDKLMDDLNAALERSAVFKRDFLVSMRRIRTREKKLPSYHFQTGIVIAIVGRTCRSDL
jgi:antitoxin component of RelBE/YafQ-DinJ toxin-antitoxin module